MTLLPTFYESIIQSSLKIIYPAAEVHLEASVISNPSAIVYGVLRIYWSEVKGAGPPDAAPSLKIE